MRKGGFTLVEVLIVVVIIGILMLMGLALNRNQLKTLKSHTFAEEISAAFDKIFLQVNTSTSIGGQHYSYLKLAFSSPDKIIQLYRGGSNQDESIMQEHLVPYLNYQDMKIAINNQEKDRLELVYRPFELGCWIGEGGGVSEPANSLAQSARIELLPQGGAGVCFDIDANYCRIKQVECGNS